MTLEKNDYMFFLGGRDLEMSVISELLEEFAPGRFFDKALAWGARASNYRVEIEACVAEGKIPVLIELEDDIGLEKVILIDHHGKLSGRQQSSLRQVFNLLGVTEKRWTRWFELVDANDRGYIPALIERGATQKEIIAVRGADRKAQGITDEEEREGEKAVGEAKLFAGGSLTVTYLAHGRGATVTDRMDKALGGTGYHNLLIISLEEVNFYGSGDIVIALMREFPGGWCGGLLPQAGFWGHGKPLPDVIPFLLRKLDNACKAGKW